jgi:uncharacterized RDD family membrane protein YckC
MQDEKQTTPDLGANPTPDPVPAGQGSSEEATSPTPAPAPAAPSPPTEEAKTADPLASEPATSSAQTTGEYAGFWIRFLALLIDGVILGVVVGVITVAFGGAAFVSAPNEPTAATTGVFAGLFGTMQLLIWAIDIVYFVGLTGTYGATLGKMMLGLRVVDTNGQKIGFGKAALREIIGKWISAFIFGLGYLWVAFDEKKQGWHDKIAGTFVVKVR